MTPVQRKIVESIINYESNYSVDDAGPVNADALRACLAAADRCASAEADLARVTAERDARLEISREDAAYYVRVVDGAVGLGGDCRDPKTFRRVHEALRAQAASATKGGEPTRPDAAARCRARADAADAREVPVLASDDARALHVGRAVLSALPDTSERTILAHRWRIAEAVRDVIAALREEAGRG